MTDNQFGTLFGFTSFGESHGKAIGCVVDGVPPNLAVTEADIQPYLDRRKPGQNRFVTQRREADEVEILSGTFEGRTTGTPICLLIKNTDQRSKDYGEIAHQFRPAMQIIPICRNTAYAIIAVAADHLPEKRLSGWRQVLLQILP